MINELRFPVGGVLIDLDYLLSFGLGLLTLLLFCIERFNQPARNSDVFAERLVPRYLSYSHNYIVTFCTYCFLMVSLFIALCIIGPNILQQFGPNIDGYQPSIQSGAQFDASNFNSPRPPDKSEPWFPLAVALILSGFSTQFPILNIVELRIRRLTHRLIGIPEGVQQVAQKIEYARLSERNLIQSGDIDKIIDWTSTITGNNIKNNETTSSSKLKHLYSGSNPENKIARKWVHLKFLFDKIENNKESISDQIDMRIINFYSDIRKSILLTLNTYNCDNIAKIALDNKAYSSRYQKNTPEFNDAINEIEGQFRDLSAWVAAASVQNAGNEEKMRRVFYALCLENSKIPKINMTNAFIVTLLMIFLFVFCIVFLTPHISYIIKHSPSEHFPQNRLDAVKWASSTLALHGFAIWGSWRFRLSRQEWQPMRVRKLIIPAREYLSVALRGYLGASLGLLLWWILTELLANHGFRLPGIEEIWIPVLGVIGAISGCWFNYSVDVAERRETLGKFRLISQAVSQGLATGLLTAALLQILQQANSVAEGVKIDFILYAGGTAFFVGLIIGALTLIFARHAVREMPEGGFARRKDDK